MLAWVVGGVVAWLVSAAGLAALVAAVIRRANRPDAPTVLIPVQRTGSPRPTATPLCDCPVHDPAR